MTEEIKIYKHEWYLRNKERLKGSNRISAKKWWAKNRERCLAKLKLRSKESRKLEWARVKDEINAERRACYDKEKQKEIYLKNRPYSKKYYENNKEKVLSYCAEYRRRPGFSEKKREWSQKYYEENFEHLSQYQKPRSKIKKGARRAKLKNVKTDKTAALFYNFVRSKKIIPCYYCGVEIAGKNAHVDHIVSLSKSGNHSSENMCASCPSCNLKKHTKSVSEFVTVGQTLLPI